MQRNDVSALAQIVTAMKEGTEKLGQAYEQRDAEKVEALKKEILKLHETLTTLL